MITAMTAAAMPMPIAVVPWEQPINRVLKVGLGAAAGFDQCEASRCVRNKDVTQPVAAVTTKLNDLLTDIGHETASGTQRHDFGIHSSIIARRFKRRPREQIHSAGVEEPHLVREHDRLHAVSEVELHQDVRDMRLHRGVADEELVPNLGVR
jgi:hypothetical protein